MFIAFEGIDGSGTTTQCELLTKKISQIGYPAIHTREPGGTPLAEQIRNLVLDPKCSRMHNLTELLLYAASRVQHVNELIRPSLETGKHVICDRFTASTWAYQGYGRNIDHDIVEKITQLAADGCVPDLTIYLDLPIHIANERRKKRGQDSDRLELEGVKFQQRVAEGYSELAQKDGVKGVVISGLRDPDEVAEDVWLELKSRWPKFPHIKSTGSGSVRLENLK